MQLTQAAVSRHPRVVRRNYRLDRGRRVSRKIAHRRCVHELASSAHTLLTDKQTDRLPGSRLPRRHSAFEIGGGLQRNRVGKFAIHLASGERA